MPSADKRESQIKFMVKPNVEERIVKIGIEVGKDFNPNIDDVRKKLTKAFGKDFLRVLWLEDTDY